CVGGWPGRGPRGVWGGGGGGGRGGPARHFVASFSMNVSARSTAFLADGGGGVSFGDGFSGSAYAGPTPTRRPNAAIAARRRTRNDMISVLSELSMTESTFR